MFDPNAGDAFQERSSGGQVVWSFGLVLKNAEANVK